MNKVIDRVNYPEDLKKLNISELRILVKEIRKFLIDTISITGGHLAPNLGVIELTIALHRVFDAPKDKLVWDVGHQAYIHKILTGRKDRLKTIRQYGGISGFPRISESEYDTFGVGHASTSISAALGFATARDLNGDDYRVVAIIGDGAMSGGISFEGLNNAGASKRNLIVVLNDNRMSISPNVGALSNYLTQIITNPLYNKIKKDIWDITGKLPRGSKRIREMVHRIEGALKSILVPGLLFEKLGFRYFGPVNGHNLEKLIDLFDKIKDLNGPILIHVITKKGKGYKYAEQNATKFHGLGSFCPKTGSTKPKKAPTYTEVFGTTLVELARMDNRIIGITAAMADGTGLVHLAKAFPERFFDVGIAEQHAVTFAAGMSLRGFKPVVAIYSTFLQRAYDQLIHDVALQEIPIVFAMDRAGLVGNDGPTHHGNFDLSYLRLIPNFVIMAPKDENELRDMLWTALHYQKGPVAIRYPRGETYGLPLKSTFKEIPIGKSEKLKDGKDLAILAAGDRVMPAVEISHILENSGISCCVINVRFIKPLDREMIESIIKKFKAVITIENNTKIGGLGTAVSEIIAECNPCCVRFKRFGIPDRFVTHGNTSDLMCDVGLDNDSLIDEIKSFYSKSR